MASLSLVSQVTCYHVQTHNDNPKRDGVVIHIPGLYRVMKILVVIELKVINFWNNYNNKNK